MTQTDHILRHLQSGKSITPLQALNRYGCLRLGARIWDLKQTGLPITSRMTCDKRTGKHYASYKLEVAA